MRSIGQSFPACNGAVANTPRHFRGTSEAREPGIRRRFRRGQPVAMALTF
jgi:hypothetical protein